MNNDEWALLLEVVVRAVVGLLIIRSAVKVLKIGALS